MPTLTLISKYRKNEGLVLTPSELKSLYFYGVDVKSKDGSELDDNTIIEYIGWAQRIVEQQLDIKIFPTLITEQSDYYKDDYVNNFPYFRTSFMVSEVCSCIGRINGVDQIKYPKEWLSSKGSSDDKFFKQIHIVPNGSVVNADADVIFTGVTAQYGLRSYPNVPTYWTVQYETGFKIDKIPSDIIHVIGTLASIPLLAIAGDLILGAGIAAQSLSIDGLSQSISSTSSATNAGYGARIIEYRKIVDQSLTTMKGYYKGINFTVI
jgi:hypothetical protein